MAKKRKTPKTNSLNKKTVDYAAGGAQESRADDADIHQLLRLVQAEIRCACRYCNYRADYFGASRSRQCSRPLFKTTIIDRLVWRLVRRNRHFPLSSPTYRETKISITMKWKNDFILQQAKLGILSLLFYLTCTTHTKIKTRFNVI